MCIVDQAEKRSVVRNQIDSGDTIPGLPSIREPTRAVVFQFGISPDATHCYYAMELIEGEILRLFFNFASDRFQLRTAAIPMV
jgi:hypothetical protein